MSDRHSVLVYKQHFEQEKEFWSFEEVRLASFVEALAYAIATGLFCKIFDDNGKCVHEHDPKRKEHAYIPIPREIFTHVHHH